MEVAAGENSQPPAFPTGDADHRTEDSPPHLANHQDAETKYDINDEEIRGIMEVIAATGKFWHDWDMLKGLLSFRLKQVWGEYPESQIVIGPGSQQNSLSGETYSELVKRLDEALLSFIEGPPFTLQRLCEILLSPKSTYRNLSKLALALEKNLLVTSTLSICTEPYPTALMQKPQEAEKVVEEPQGDSNSVPNGVEAMEGDGDEEMTEAEADEDIDATNRDTDMIEEKVNETSESNSAPSSNSDPSSEPSAKSEEQNFTTVEAP